MYLLMGASQEGECEQLDHMCKATRNDAGCSSVTVLIALLKGGLND